MPARALQLLAAATLALIFAYFLLVYPGAHDVSFSPWPDVAFSAPSPNNITQDLEVLKKLKVPQSFEYRRICVVAREKRGLTRQPLVQLAHNLLENAEPATILLDGEWQPDSPPASILPGCSPNTITIDVPEFSSHAHADTSALMLGVATTSKRVNDSLPTFSRWLANTGSTLVALLVDKTNLDDDADDLAEIATLAESLGIQIIFEPYRYTFEHDSEGLKNFGLATVLDKHRKEETKWFGVIDDDTFFLSLPRMLEALAPFDHTQEWYIGALTEGHTRVAEEGFKAWGGAGFFVSPPLMRLLAENAVQCTPLDKFFGDILWRDCIIEVTSPTVTLTELRGLNQMDLWNDLSGWYEAGFSPILTVHHWKSWHQFPIANAHLVSDVAGPDALLQRYQFGNHTVFTNGYSIVDYPIVMPDLNLVELTMTEDVSVRRPPERLEFHRSMGRTRPALKIGTEKISWRFRASAKTTDGTVRQFYVKRVDEDVSIIEIDWRRASGAG